MASRLRAWFDGLLPMEAKLVAARELGLPVILIDRPHLPDRRVAGTVGEVMAWLRY